MKHELQMKSDNSRLWAYLGDDAAGWANMARDTSRGKVTPYSAWKWTSVGAPGHKQDGFRWLWRRYRLQRWMASGGIVVIVGATRTGKTCLLERLPLQIIDNSGTGTRRNAPVTRDDLPSSGLFAIDETPSHDRMDILHVLDDPAVRSRGFALVFQHPGQFQACEFWPFFATRKVLILEFSTNQTPIRA